MPRTGLRTAGAWWHSAHMCHVTECHQRSNQLQASPCQYQTHRSAHGMCSDPSPPHGGDWRGGLYVMSRNRVRDPPTSRDAFPVLPMTVPTRIQGPIRARRVVHPSPPAHPAAASTFETPQLVVYTLNISFFDRKVGLPCSFPCLLRVLWGFAIRCA